MTAVIPSQLAAIQRMTVGELRAKYAELSGEPAKTWNRLYLVKRCSYLVQERALGGLSGRARARAAELLDETAILRSRPNAALAGAAPSRFRDPRLPAVGAVLEREHAGRVHRVTVHATDFEYEGSRFRSLSAIAKKIAGTPWNGFSFFGLAPRVTSEPGT